ncbi:hypothetical protein EYF80_030380 [Liparis tanakae]|uniref:Uncharacterized protein n=1 Tax=Liparis tanakae TaxID=230148 RepID=A0A4Z2H238_9TELE|nr:hypothetical protein EYF80_030380 [Liparis tanakae]
MRDCFLFGVDVDDSVFVSRGHGSGHQRTSVDPRGPQRTTVDPRGPQRTPEDPIGPQWTPEDPRGPHSTTVDPRGPQWTPEDPIGPQWTSEDHRAPVGTQAGLFKLSGSIAYMCLISADYTTERRQGRLGARSRT